MTLWIRIDANIGENPNVWKLAGVRGLSANESVGLLVVLFGKVAEHCPHGNVSDVPDALLERWAGWTGEPGAFATSFRELFVSDGVVEGWEKRQGKLVERAEKERQRAAARRAADSTPKVRGQSANESAARNGTVRNEVKEKGGADAPARAVKVVRPPRSATSAWATEGVAWWEPNVGTLTVATFSKELSPVVRSHGWPAVFADLQKWVAQRKRAGKAINVKWYASEASARITAAPAPAIVDDHGCLTEYGERITRPDKVPA